MGQPTHVAVTAAMYSDAHGAATLRRRLGRDDRALNAKTQEPTMTAESYNRRRTDRGYIARTRSTLQALRKVLGLLPVSESLQALQHWRRRPATDES